MIQVGFLGFVRSSLWLFRGSLGYRTIGVVRSLLNKRSLLCGYLVMMLGQRYTIARVLDNECITRVNVSGLFSDVDVYINDVDVGLLARIVGVLVKAILNKDVLC